MKFRNELCISILASLASFACSPFLGLGRSQSSIQDPGRPDEKQLVREQIASIKQQISQLPDRGAALYLLSALNQQLGDTGEALKVLRECVSLREGFDPDGSPNLGVLRGERTLMNWLHRSMRSSLRWTTRAYLPQME
jgi:hypothetical protein